ncbi:MAG: NADH:ubiquinone reductase (Na(+)-transporting) subunit C [Deltaproteobacteria bacterium]|nr:NADH:ubiquinone reductase (Na(+)-transporting) subunit C [Deltaproteobacteria bacterium]
MPTRRGPAYTVGFAAAVCVVCAILVSVSAVTLRERQEDNRRLDSKRNVLLAAGLVEADADPSRDELEALFAEAVESVVIDRENGRTLEDVDPADLDSDRLLVYRVTQEGRAAQVVLPVSGAGLWSTLYGFLALDVDGTTVRGLAFYEHGETPGLGGEVDNPKWRALWPGRQVFDESGEVRIEVIKGRAGAPADDPHRVDGLSGATMTSRGVSELVRFWVSEHGYGVYLGRLRRGTGR